MEVRKKNSAKLLDDGFSDPMKSIPKTNFQRHILKSVIGDARANQVLNRTLGIIPQVNSGSMGQSFKESK